MFKQTIRPATARAATASSKARSTAIKTDTIRAEARRNYVPPPSAGKKQAMKDAQKAEKMHSIEESRAQD